MKLLIAIIQPDKLDEVHEALVAAGIARITASRASGQGRAQEMELYRGQEVAASRMPKVRLEIALNDEFVEPCIAAIVKQRQADETVSLLITPTGLALEVRFGGPRA